MLYFVCKFYILGVNFIFAAEKAPEYNVLEKACTSFVITPIY